MGKTFAIIAVASWENRFIYGLEKNIHTYCPDEVIMFFYSEYAILTEANRKKMRDICKERKIKLIEKELFFSESIRSWKTIREVLLVEKYKNNILVDFSTMPRETIYSVFYFLDSVSAKTHYIYYRPEQYNKEWLSRDPGKPRLVLKLSGITIVGQKTILVILTGFDSERTRQLIRYFDPSLTLIVTQEGKQYDNEAANIIKHKKLIAELSPEIEIEEFSIDAYSQDNGYSLLENKIESILNKGNIVLSSLGPKPSAVSLYKVHRRYPQIALAYAPSNEFNPAYSTGIMEKNPVIGILKSEELK